MTARDWDSRAYKDWRLAVKRRDSFRCRWCGSRKRLHVHHIKRWADHPELRYQLSNGVTLCRVCHNKVNGQEEVYEDFLRRLIGDDSLIRIQRLLHQSRKQQCTQCGNEFEQRDDDLVCPTCWEQMETRIR